MRWLLRFVVFGTVWVAYGRRSPACMFNAEVSSNSLVVVKLLIGYDDRGHA